MRKCLLFQAQTCKCPVKCDDDDDDDNNNNNNNVPNQ
jgi:hypothetical protein